MYNATQPWTTIQCKDFCFLLLPSGPYKLNHYFVVFSSRCCKVKHDIMSHQAAQHEAECDQWISVTSSIKYSALQLDTCWSLCTKMWRPDIFQLHTLCAIWWQIPVFGHSYQKRVFFSLAHVLNVGFTGPIMHDVQWNAFVVGRNISCFRKASQLCVVDEWLQKSSELFRLITHAHLAPLMCFGHGN